MLSRNKGYQAERILFSRGWGVERKELKELEQLENVNFRCNDVGGNVFYVYHMSSATTRGRARQRQRQRQRRG
jgi:hypothetical protein